MKIEYKLVTYTKEKLCKPSTLKLILQKIVVFVEDFSSNIDSKKFVLKFFHFS